MTGPSASWDYPRYCDALGQEIARLADAVRGADPASPVPTCPGWTLDDLVKHVGGVHRWAGHMVRDGARERLSRRHVELGLIEGQAPDADWIIAGGELLLDWLRAADADAPVWVWGADPHVRFWARRMLHETTVHRADAELAANHQPTIDPAVATDGIDEFLDNLPGAAYFAPRVTELHGDGQTLAWRTTDTDDRWVITLEPDRFRWQRAGADSDVTVEASAADLVLLTYGRRSIDDHGRFTVTGDSELLAWWQERSSI
ncbi:MAG: maleylpyruvate isomerase family mycothiol-dependent enzyme [Acidimicrobiales bacterium]